jgi:hypothetical protein
MKFKSINPIQALPDALQPRAKENEIVDTEKIV